MLETQAAEYFADWHLPHLYQEREKWQKANLD